ncbi:MAG: exonuclease domain-containing protein [Lachnospiraceae bacterium]|nr:exonuclease domain-containing protein [Candidatus Darwinimomas equi]
MQTYIVFDLEWNQSANGREGSVPGLPFEIIEIGAVKLDENFSKISTFRRVIRPVVYEKLHYRVLEVVNLGIQELRENGLTFAEAAGDFFDWCYKNGEQPIFCTWGEMDLAQLEKNMDYFKVKNPLPFPLLYYDLQKLYTLHTEGHHKTMAPLDRAVDEMEVIDDGGFHSALNDALYTAQVMQRIDMRRLRPYMSLDYTRLPQCKEDEIYLVFPDYFKYVSRVYPSKESAMKDPVSKEMLCCKCQRPVRKTINWFTNNQKQYHCIAYCPEHGLLKGKLRVKHNDAGEVYLVKTIKMVSHEKAVEVENFRNDIKNKKKQKS